MTETSEDYQLALGSLRSQVTLTLHTYHATRIWNGQKRTADKSESFRPTPGMQSYFAATNIIKLAASRDDPFADWWMIQIEERVEVAKKKMEQLSEQLDTVIHQIPTQISISDNLNQKPLSIPLYVGSHIGFQGVYLLEAYDRLVRKILLANHTGLLGRSDMERYLDQGAHQLRSLLELAQRYKNTGVSRDDIAANNAKARAAIDRYGLPPQDILEGARRSDFAPRINRPSRDARTLADLPDILNEAEQEATGSSEEVEEQADESDRA